jgi:hypothetical protein
MANQPSMYGINNSNRSAEKLWSKNNFNSAFPVGLVCYMRDHRVKPVYLRTDAQGKIAHEYIDVSKIWGSTLPNDDLLFLFEKSFDPFASITEDASVPKIDLVVAEPDANGEPARWLRPLEVKLTALPDSSTVNSQPADWGTEIVFRPNSFQYCAMTLMNSLGGSRSAVRAILDGPCSAIVDWSNESEVLSNSRAVISALETFVKQFHSVQQPLILNPIWKTKGQVPDLQSDAFDVFIWSNLALTSTVINQAKNGLGDRSISRPLRTGLQLARMLREWARAGTVNVGATIAQMSYSKQTDKAMSISGRVTQPILASSELDSPRVKRSVLPQILNSDGKSLLKPERRFDATVSWFTDDLNFS